MRRYVVSGKRSVNQMIQPGLNSGLAWLMLLQPGGAPIPTTEIGWVEWGLKTGGWSLMGLVAFALTARAVGRFMAPLISSWAKGHIELLGVMTATQRHMAEKVDDVAKSIDHIDTRVTRTLGVIRRNCGKHEPESDDELDSGDSGKASR